MRSGVDISQFASGAMARKAEYICSHTGSEGQQSPLSTQKWFVTVIHSVRGEFTTCHKASSVGLSKVEQVIYVFSVSFFPLL